MMYHTNRAPKQNTYFNLFSMNNDFYIFQFPSTIFLRANGHKRRILNNLRFKNYAHVIFYSFFMTIVFSIQMFKWFQERNREFLFFKHQIIFTAESYNYGFLKPVKMLLFINENV